MALFKGLIKEGNIVANPAADITPLANTAFNEARAKLSDKITSLKDFFAFMQNNEAFLGDKVLSSIKARIEEARKLGNLRQYRVVQPETLEIESFGYKHTMDRIIDDQPVVATAKINYLLANLDKVIELLSLEDVDFNSFNLVKPEGNCTYNLNRYINNLAQHADKLHLVEGNLGNLSDTKETFSGELVDAITRYPAVAAAEIENFVEREKAINAKINEILQNLGAVGDSWNENLQGLAQTYKIINELNNKSFNLLTEKAEYEELLKTFEAEIDSRAKDEPLTELRSQPWLKQEEFNEKKLAALLQKQQSKYLEHLQELASKQNLLKKVGEDYELYKGINNLLPYELMRLLSKDNNFVIHTNNVTFDSKEKDFAKLSENVLFLTDKQNLILESEYYRLCDAMKTRNLGGEFPNFAKDYKNGRKFEGISFETKKEIFNFINKEGSSLYKALTAQKQNNFDSFYVDTLLTEHIMVNLDTVHTLLQLEGYKNTKQTLEEIMLNNTYTNMEVNEEIDKNYAIYCQTTQQMQKLQAEYKKLDLSMQKYKAAYYQPYKNLGFAAFDTFNKEMAEVTFPIKKDTADKTGYFDKEFDVLEIDIDAFKDAEEKYGEKCTDEIEKIEQCLNSEEKDDANKVQKALDLISLDERHKTNIRKTIVNHTIAFTELVRILNKELFTSLDNENK